MLHPAPEASGPPAGADPVDAFLAEAATRGERAVSVARAVFCGAVLVRYAAFGGLQQRGAVVIVPAIAAAIAVSAFLLWSSRAGPLRRRHLALSVVVDAAVCFAALLPNVLWPAAGEEGLFTKPDVAALLVVAMGAGFRLYPAVTLGAGALHLASFSALAALDVTRWGSALYLPARNISILAILLLGALALAALSGARTLRLAHAAAARAVEVERARRALSTLLREHHDVRSFLSSATLNSDVMLRSLARGGAGGGGSGGGPGGGAVDDALAALALDLRADLMQMHRLVSEVKERSFAELAVLDGPQAADVGAVVARTVEAVGRRFPRVQVEAGPVEAGLRVDVVGGSTGLERVLLNLLVNACEGDGERGAARVRADVEARGPRVAFAVEDDGPGFPAALLSSTGGPAGAPTGPAGSRKPEGSGFGLMLTDGLVQGSGGAWRRENRAGGGARVVVELARSREGERAKTVALPGGGGRG